MSLKKIIKSPERAQSALEYFLLLLAVASLTLLGVTTLLPKIQEKGEGFFQRAEARITR